MQSISQRGDRANLRLERDHLECDTLWGRQRDDNRLLVIIDRKSRYVRLGLFKKTAVATAMGAKALLKGSRFKTLTCDRGGEFARLPQFFKDKLFVCHAYRADERGSCENVNRGRPHPLRNTLRSTALADSSYLNAAFYALAPMKHSVPLKAVTSSTPLLAL